MAIDPKSQAILDNMSPREVVGAARRRVCTRQPYFSDIMWGLKLVALPGSGTFAVDDGMRLFYDPERAKAWGVRYCPTFWAHEVQHVRRRHAKRALAMAATGLRGKYAKLAHVIAKLYPGVDSFETLLNWAFDFEINDEVERAGWEWPPDFVPLNVKRHGLPTGKTGEFYVREMLNRAQQEANDVPDQPQGSGRPPQTGGQSTESGSATAKNPGPATGDGQVGAPAESKERNPRSGDSDGNGQDDQGSKGGDAQGGDTASGDAPAVAGADAGGDGGGGEPTAVGQGRCGGCAGHSLKHEKRNDPSLPPKSSPDEIEMSLAKTAAKIRDWKPGPGRGVAPGTVLTEWANEMFAPPKVDAMALLRKEVQSAIASRRGRDVRKWSRPNRREEVVAQWMGDEAPLMPGLRGARPRVILVLDVSGSMGWGVGSRAARATNELLGFVRAAQGDAFGIAVDAKVQTAVPVRNEEDVRKLNARGRGGTDMRLGITAAADSRLRGDVIVLITDGETAWTARSDMPKQPVVTLIISENEQRAMRDCPDHFRDHAVFVSTKD